MLVPVVNLSELFTAALISTGRTSNRKYAIPHVLAAMLTTRTHKMLTKKPATTYKKKKVKCICGTLAGDDN